MPIIRGLFGDLDTKCSWSNLYYSQLCHLKKEVQKSLKYDWVKNDVYHFAIGQKNYDMLKKYGAKKVEMITPEYTLAPNSKMSPFYNKVYIMKYAMEKFDEILFIDFDTFPHGNKKPDKKMWKLLRNKKGRFNGEFQAPNAQHKRPFCLEKKQGGFRERRLHPVRRNLNTSTTYCNNKVWIDEWLEHYLEYQKLLGGKIHSKHDEYPLMYYLDKKYGVMDFKDDHSLMIENFEPAIVKLTNIGTPEAQKSKKRDDLYFLHH